MHRHRAARSRLDSAFLKQRPVVVMVGADSFDLGHVITTFVSGLDKRTTSVRLRQPQENALAALAEINRAIGFDPKDLTLSDLQKVLTLFLEHQSRYRRRTVLSVEQADQQSMWLLDCLNRLIKATGSSAIGQNLLVVLSGSNRLTEVLRNSAFDVIREKAGLPVRLQPFSIFETREFLRQLSSSAGLGDIQGVFEFEAVERLHRISGGVPHVVAQVFRECVSIVREKGSRSASSKVVVQAARKLRASRTVDSGLSAARPTLNRKPGTTARRLLVRCPKRPALEIPLKAGRYMVGRAVRADIHLPSLLVSWRHALLIVTNDALQVLDLGSTNGTFAGTERVSEATLSPGTVLSLGDCRIEYHAG